MNETGLIFKKISAVMGDIGAIGKDRQNAEQKYKFRGIEDLYNAARPAMLRHGVFCAPSVLEYESTERATRNGGIATRVIMRVNHKFYCEDGSFVEVVTTGEGIDHSDKAANKCLSAAFKYALMELFCVPTQDIDDSDRSTPEPGDASASPVKSAPVTFVRPATGEAKAEAKAPAKAKPKAADAKAVEESADLELAPVIRDGIAYISKNKQDYMRLRFEDSLDAKYRQKPIADQLRKGWLKSKGFIGENGEGTSTMVPQDKYPEVFKELMTWAKQQGNTDNPDPDIPF